MRGRDRLWWTEGSDCSAPRILYVHGGNWTHHGPLQSSYDVLASKVAKITNAVVFVPDFRLVPMGNYSDTIKSLLQAWRWLGTHGPGAIDCSAAPIVPQFVGGDSSGGASALSLVLVLRRFATSAGEDDMGPPPAGLFGFSPWTNLASDTPTYYSEAFAKLEDAPGAADYVGDLLHPDVPRSKSLRFREIALAYVGSPDLLEDPVASPFHAEEDHLRGMPPMYFAVSGTESMTGDAVVLATRAADFGIPVAVDIFPSMWHVFPQYSEGCGAGRDLWQGVVALMHTGDFVRQIFAAAKNHPGRSFFVPDGSSPQTEFYYAHPTGKPPWLEPLPLELVMGAMTSDREPVYLDPSLLETTADGAAWDAVEGASAVPLRQLEESHALGDYAEEDVEGCSAWTMTSAFFFGAVGGAICMAVGLVFTWFYHSQKHGLCMRMVGEVEKDTRSVAKAYNRERMPSGRVRYQSLPSPPERVTDSAASSKASSTRGIPAPFWMRPGTAVRREIRSMPLAEQERFAEALKRVMLNREGKPQTSEYFEIAGASAWPSGLGQHGSEAFPSWNRGHLVALERALVRADRELGNDGTLGLPYWDWSRPKVNREVLPRVLREHFNPMPDGLVDPNKAGLFGRLGYKLQTDLQVQRLLEASQAAFEAEQAVTEGTHWRLASRHWHGRGFSLESAHDSVLHACGFPLSDPEYSAFHPLFFLLRCNLDRLYEQHLRMFDHAACCGEMERHQKQLRENGGELDRFEAPLQPFEHPFERRKLMPTDTFATQDLGYVYDGMPDEPLAEQLGSGPQREEPSYAVFRGVDPRCLRGKSYMLHVFVMPKELSEAWCFPAGGPEVWQEDKRYAGCCGVFGRRGTVSTGVQQAKTCDVLVEVQKALQRQRLSRHDAGICVMCVDQFGGASPREETPIPAPVLVGPLFEDMTATLEPDSVGGEVQQLQDRLARLGFGSSPAPERGTFGPETVEAVRQFQKFFRLREDGMAGRAVKEHLVRQRFDLMPDFPPASATPRRSLTKGGTLRYLVRTLPSNLERQREVALREISDAFSQWGEALQVDFLLSESRWRVDVSLRFADLSAEGAEFYGGSAVRGGQLSEVAEKTITLDSGEYWLLSRDDVPLRRPQAVRLFPVLLHAIGHFVGLPHSSSPQDVMSPFYEGEDSPQVLSPNDTALARAQVVDGGCQHQ